MLSFRLSDLTLFLQHSSAAITQRYIGIEPQRIEEAIKPLRDTHNYYKREPKSSLHSLQS